MPDADEHGPGIGPGAKDEADLLTLVHERRRRTSLSRRLFKRAEESALGDANAGDIQDDRHVGGEPTPPRVGVALAVKTDDAELMLQGADCIEHGRAFSETQERRDVRVFHRASGVDSFDDPLRLAVVNERDGEDRLLVGGEGNVGAGDEARKRIERPHDEAAAHFDLFRLPGLDQGG